MTKISLKALELAGYKNANEIAEIISYVPNPTTALEMLLGVFEPTDINSMNKYFKYQDNTIIEITSVEDLANRISYKSYNCKTKTVWAVTGSDYRDKIFVETKPENYYSSTNISNGEGYTVDDTEATKETFYDRYKKSLTEEEFYSTLAVWSKNLKEENEL
jgi:hypothetical protein